MVMKIYLPAMRHPIINGVRLGFGFAMIGTLLAETKLSNKGIGFLIIQAYSIFDMPRMYAMLIVLFVLAIGANALVGTLGGLDTHQTNLERRGRELMKHFLHLRPPPLRIASAHAGVGRRSGQDDDRPARQLGYLDHPPRRQGRHLQEARHRSSR